MIHIFIDRSAVSPLAKRNFSKNNATRASWIVDIVSLPMTYIVQYDPSAETYSVQESIRNDSADWKNRKTNVSISDASIEDSDDIAGLLELVNNGSPEEKRIILGFLMARQAENYLYECGFWNNNQEPDEKTGGILIAADGGELSAKVVCGKDRPDMMYIPYKAKLRDIGYVLESGDPQMGRPYQDEYISKLVGK